MRPKPSSFSSFAHDAQKRRPVGAALLCGVKRGEQQVILHCMKESVWKERREKAFWGQRDLEKYGFLHCSSIAHFWRVAPNFKEVIEPLVLVCIDETKLAAPVRYEDLDGCGRAYPHIYGLVNQSAVVQVLPFLKDADGNYQKNEEFAAVTEE